MSNQRFKRPKEYLPHFVEGGYTWSIFDALRDARTKGARQSTCNCHLEKPTVSLEGSYTLLLRLSN